jgi:hypothetical protein
VVTVGRRQDDRLPAVLGRFDDESGMLQQPPHDLARHGVVLDQQDALAAMADRRPLVGSGSSDGRSRVRRLAQANRTPEDAADAHFAAQADLAVHQVRQPTADRQAQPAAAVLSRQQAVGLLEGFEHENLVGCRNADAGIHDFTAQA